MPDGSRDNMVLLAFPGNESMADALATRLGIQAQLIALHRFPDGETLVTLPTGLKGRDVVLVCTLDRPDAKLAPLLFAADAARDLGARRVGLLAPYLAYMRQDQRFHAGEAVSSRTFARTLSQHLDFLLTVDPHLHRFHHLSELYDIPTQVVNAAPAIAAWLRDRVARPLFIGPDSESGQWVADVAAQLKAPYLVLDKVRSGDSEVAVSLPEHVDYADYTPVLLDDILSTGRTLQAAVAGLIAKGLPAPLCICVHPVMAGDAYAALQAAGAARVLSCNTLPHPSNAIDIVPLLADALISF